MWKKRAVSMLYVYMLLFLVLLARLIQIQLWEPESFSAHDINLVEESVFQRSQELIMDDGRGRFLDKNGQSLTHKDVSVLILFPFLKNTSWPVEQVASIAGVQEGKLLEAVKMAKKPFAYGEPEPHSLSASQVSSLNALKIPGVFAVEKKLKKSDAVAGQLIGSIGENQAALEKRYPDRAFPPRTPIGISGLEKSFDEFLVAEGKSRLVFHVDGSGSPLFGTKVKYTGMANPFYPVSIKTTIDADIQQHAEQMVDNHGISKGGLLLLDISSNSILASVSRPEIDSKDPFKGDGMTNLMLKEQIIGSVFKTVVAAAAIDNSLANEDRQFNCSRTIDGKPDPVYQHGLLGFSDSFAASCNNTFATLAKELMEIDPGILENYASKLSLTGGAGWEGDVFQLGGFHQLSGEEKGRVFLSDEERTDRNFVALSGIGQKEVRATPLAVANMMATIARGGKKEMVRAVFEVDYKNGTTMYEFPQKELEGEHLSTKTANELGLLLREVVMNDKGTGRWFAGLPYEVAGKSGTAETGRYRNDKQLHNKWFAGFFPYSNPQYALVTVNLDVFDDMGGVNPLFAEMVTYLYNRDHEIQGN
ncbi:penicillin-binding protein [Bacillus sp. FJAT-27225]|uniref:penicillin-binding transpeptidase domain-containing protein n=1 Tax=Bacillus sp. FJAT-27225 TaxID=1743144 RepID=UPI00080C34CC|nr:penicillin-binding transpeptidase domain-containing protein [Bacillus sp. FJAT-27225]OCA91197.1 penicillin-binding protein [Bacillus sp. FJAT-27225]